MLIIVRNHDLQKRIAAVFIESMLMEIIGQILSAIPGFAPAGRSKPAHKLVQARTINNEKMFDKNLECFRNRLKPDNRDPEEMKSCGKNLHYEDLEWGYAGSFLFDSIESKFKKMPPESWCGNGFFLQRARLIFPKLSYWLPTKKDRNVFSSLFKADDIFSKRFTRSSGSFPSRLI